MELVRKNIELITIGGIEYPIDVKNYLIKDYYRKLRTLAVQYEVKPTDNEVLKQWKIEKVTAKLNDLLYKLVFKSLVSTGHFLWKKPFRSKTHMYKSISYNEDEAIQTFLSKVIFKEEPSTNDNKKKGG